MTKIQLLQLTDFKSYKGTHEIGPFEDFTAIIGPNGSGKSNIMDAISFALGFNSVPLRSSQLRDLIYRGPHNSNDLEYKPQQASVYIKFVKLDGTVIQFGRSVNMKGTTEYSIDGRLRSFKEYNKMLESQNVFIKAKNFLVFQGAVEMVASQSSQHLTGLIEQISGSEELKVEYDRLKTELDRAIENSNFEFNKKRGVQAEVKLVQEQKQEAEKYNTLKAKKNHLILEQILSKIFYLEKQFLNKQKSIQELENAIKFTEDDLNIADKKLEACLSESSTKKLKIIDIESKSKKSETKRRQEELIKIKLTEEYSYLEAKLKNLESLKLSVNRDLEFHSKSMNNKKSEITKLKALLDKHEKELQSIIKDQKSKHKIKIEENDRKKYKELSQESEIKTFQNNNKLDSINLSRRPLVDLKNITLDKVQENLNKLNNIEKEKIYVESQINKANDSISSNSTLLKEYEKNLNYSQNNIARLEKIEKESNEKLRIILNKLLSANAENLNNEKEIKHKEVIDALKRLFPGVFGRLNDLCRPIQRRFDVAISTALGSNLDAVIVQDSSVAIECIKYIKDQRISPIKFLPVNSVKVVDHSETMRKIKSLNIKGVKEAIQLVEFDKKIENAVLYALSGSVVCDSIEIAKNLLYQHGIKVKAVTLNSTVLHRSGLITGGDSNMDSKNSKKWEEKELKELKSNRDELLQLIQETIASKNKLNQELNFSERINIIKLSLESDRVKVSSMNRQIKSFDSELEFIKNQNKDLDKTLKDTEIQISKADKEAKLISTQIDQIKSDLFRPLYSKLGRSSIKDLFMLFELDENYDNAHALMSPEWNIERSKLINLISKLENEFDFENGKSKQIGDRLMLIEGEYKSTVKDDLDKKIALDQKNSQITKLNKEFEELKKEKLSIQNEFNVFAIKNVDPIKKQRQILARKLIMSKGTLQESLSEAENCITETTDSLKSSIWLDLHIKCKMNGRVLSPDEISKLPSIGEYKWGKEGVRWPFEIDYSKLSSEAKKSSDENRNKVYLGQIESIENEMEAMAPNLKALDKYSTIEKNFEASRKSAKTIKDKFNTVKQKRYELFMKAYNFIAESIDKIYKDLTRTPLNPMGGTSYLTLEDNDEPYLHGIKYHAMPPFKRFRDMEQLSGGEKSIAAFALIFAIHSYRPSPFFVLDEVDAALDNTNIEVVGRYLRKTSTNIDSASMAAQYIVISLKPQLFVHSNLLVGVTRVPSQNTSKTFNLNVTDFE